MIQGCSKVRRGAGTGSQAGFTPPTPREPALCQAPREAWGSVRKERRARPQGCFRGVGLLPERPSACRSQKHPLGLSKAAAAQRPAPHLAPQPLLNPAQAQPSAQRAAPHPSPSPVGASLWPQTPNSPPGSNTHKGRLRQVPLSPRCFYDLLHGERQGLGSSSHTRSGQSHRRKRHRIPLLGKMDR